MLALVGTRLTQHALADTAPMDATMPIKHLNEALLATMKPVTRPLSAAAFGRWLPWWTKRLTCAPCWRPRSALTGRAVPPDQQDRLLQAFRRYTVASYVGNFARYDGQSFTIVPDTRSLDRERVVITEPSRAAPRRSNRA